MAGISFYKGEDLMLLKPVTVIDRKIFCKIMFSLSIT